MDNKTKLKRLAEEAAWEFTGAYIGAVSQSDFSGFNDLGISSPFESSRFIQRDNKKDKIESPADNRDLLKDNDKQVATMSVVHEEGVDVGDNSFRSVLNAEDFRIRSIHQDNARDNSGNNRVIYRQKEDLLAGFKTRDTEPDFAEPASLRGKEGFFSAQNRAEDDIKSPVVVREPADSGNTLALDGARAFGGPVNAGKSYLVGEKGPEILRMGNVGGSVVPNEQIGGGSSFVLNIENINISAGSEGGDIAEQVKSALNELAKTDFTAEAGLNTGKV